MCTHNIIPECFFSVEINSISVGHRINHNQCSLAGYSLVANVDLLLAYDRLRDTKFANTVEGTCPHILPRVNPILVETLLNLIWKLYSDTSNMK
jgi:hypothetical protein